MAQNIQFFVDDTSPTVSYSPFRDTLSIPDLLAGWNPYFDGSGFPSAMGDVGIGNSYHATSFNNASLSLQWKGTGIQLFGYTNHSSYDILLDGTPQSSVNADLNDNILAAFQNLTNDVHTVSLVSNIPTINTPPKSVVFFDKALVISVANVPNDTLFIERSIDQQAISYIGQWSFLNISNNPIHRSNTKGDIAQTQFTGVSFQLSGTTSPTSGKYSVVLDDVVATFSAQSSLTQQDSLLFFATGLDPGTSHELRVINEDGGELSLNTDGFKVYSAQPPITPTSPPTGSLGMGHGTITKGTIAALVLAGLLSFLLLSGSLYYWFVVRPCRRRARQMARPPGTRKKNPVENVIERILDIAPQSRGDVEASSPHSSKKSGFTRWKREVEGGYNTRTIGIVFRHSDPGGDVGGQNGPPSVKSLASSISKYSKGKKPKRANRSSWSPSFVLELPVRPVEGYGSKQDHDIINDSVLLDHPPSMASELPSLSYVSAAPPTPKLPPSYPNCAKPQSVPRSVSLPDPSPKSHHDRSGSNGLLLDDGEPSIGTFEVRLAGNYAPTPASLALPPDQDRHPPSPARRRDDGYSSEDATSDIGTAISSLAIRSLSPRTSEFPKDLRNHHDHVLSEREALRISSPVGVTRSSFAEVPSPVDQHHPEPGSSSQQAGVGGFFLDAQAPPSPFHVNFGGTSLQERVHDQIEAAVANEQAKASEPLHTPEKASRKLRTILRITPPSLPPSPAAPPKESVSFIDFNNSSDVSYRTHSIAPTENSSSGHDHHRAGPSRQPLARPSMPTVHSTSDEISSPAPTSPLSPPLPYPTSPSPSPHRPLGHATPSVRPAQRALPRLIPPDGLAIPPADNDTVSARPHVHPISMFPSPTESVPVSVTEIRFRRGDSMDETRSHASSILPPHRGLPSSSTGSRERGGSSTPGHSPVPSSFIVKHVLGRTAGSGGTLSPTPPGRTRYP